MSPTKKDKNAFWEVDLGECYNIIEIIVKARKACLARLFPAKVLIGHEQFPRYLPESEKKAVLIHEIKEEYYLMKYRVIHI